MKDQAVAQNESLQSDEFVIFVFFNFFLKEEAISFYLFFLGGEGGSELAS